MTNWSHNHTVFVGPKVTLDTIASTITPEGEFDFELIAPTPKVLDVCDPPTTVMDDDAFAAKYNFEQAPTTIEDFTTIAQGFRIATDAEGHARKLQDMPATVHGIIKETYGDSDWFTWRVNNWGTKWTGANAEATRYHDNLLIVTYKTAWAPPEGVFKTLSNTYNNLHIINGSNIEDFDDGIEVTYEDRTSFLTYFTTSSVINVGVYDYRFNTDPTKPDVDGAKRDVALLYTERCTINEANIKMLIDAGMLVGEDEEVIEINSLG